MAIIKKLYLYKQNKKILPKLKYVLRKEIRT